MERTPNLASEFKSDNIWPLFWPKTVESWQNTRFSLFCFTVFLAEKGSYVILFEFWGQIWNPLIILHILDPHMILLFPFYFLTPMHFQKLQIKFITPKSAWNRLFRTPSNSTCSKTWETTRRAFQFPKLMFFAQI